MKKGEPMPPDWFTNEAISNYITFIAGVLVALIVWAIRTTLQRTKPSIIQVEKEFETSLVDIDPEVQKNLQVTYKDTSITELHRALFHIYNAGQEPIKDIKLRFIFSNIDPNGFLEVGFYDNRIEDLEQRVTPITSEGDEFEGIEIQIPFLNPYKEHQDFCTMQIYSPRPIILDHVFGIGLGWSTKYLDRAAYRRRIIDTLFASPIPAKIITSIFKLLDIFAKPTA